MKWSAADYQFMARAVQLARKGLYTTHPNPRVGCVLAKDGKIIAEGWHWKAGTPHAEVNAINAAADQAAGSICYVTLEPCCHTGRTPPCTDAIIRAGISRVITAMEDPNPLVAGQGLAKLENAGMATASGLLKTEAAGLNPGYIKRMTEQLPYVRCKLAVSLDGRTAMENGESKWISGDQSRTDVQRLRAESDAIMTGIGTLLADDPQLNVREYDLAGRHPLRVIIDRDLKSPANARIFSLPGRSLIFTRQDQSKQKQFNNTNAELISLDEKDEEFLSAVLSYLAVTENINEVLVEAGPHLAGSLLIQGLLDEIILYQAPVILGNRAQGLFHLPMLQSMHDKIELQVIDSRRVGPDNRITLKVTSN